MDAQLKGDKANDVLLNRKGRLLRISSNSDSMASFEIADSAVKQWEEAKGAAAVAGQMARRSGRRLPRLRVQDYEKVMLTTVMAMNGCRRAIWTPRP